MKEMDLGLAKPPGSTKQALAIDPRSGYVAICNGCREITVDLGSVRFATRLEGFQALVLLLNRAAANYEIWLESKEPVA